MGSKRELLRVAVEVAFGDVLVVVDRVIGHLEHLKGREVGVSWFRLEEIRSFDG